MRHFLFIILILVLIFSGISCSKNFEYGPSSGNLEFSKDTVFLDTVFSNIGSSTYHLKVYNPTRDDFEIPSIRLGQGEQSGYRLNVDGVAGKTFKNVPIRAQDSMFIFIEVTFDGSAIGQNEFLYTDRLLFDVDDDQQHVELVTLIKDAVFLFPKTDSEGIKETISIGSDGAGNEIKVDGFYLSDGQLQFTNEKPYVIYGYAGVANGKTLTIDEGARVHFHKDSGIYVAGGGRIAINGDVSEDLTLLEKEVIFEGDRLEPEFANIPGQWGTILIDSASTDNDINHLTIRNATVGISVKGDGLLNSPTLSLKNSQIRNSLSVNLWAKSASITAENLILGGAGDISLYLNLGGDYSFKHCTIANYWMHGFRTGKALRIDNFEGNKMFDLDSATFANCIVDGSQSRELEFFTNTPAAFNFSFTNCLISFEKNAQFENDPLYDFENPQLYRNPFLNEPINFVDSFGGDFELTASSFAIDKGDLQIAAQVPLDIYGQDRKNAPDIGAIEFKVEN